MTHIRVGVDHKVLICFVHKLYPTGVSVCKKPSCTRLRNYSKITHKAIKRLNVCQVELLAKLSIQIKQLRIAQLVSFASSHLYSVLFQSSFSYLYECELYTKCCSPLPTYTADYASRSFLSTFTLFTSHKCELHNKSNSPLPTFNTIFTSHIVRSPLSNFTLTHSLSYLNNYELYRQTSYSLSHMHFVLFTSPLLFCFTRFLIYGLARVKNSFFASSLCNSMRSRNSCVFVQLQLRSQRETLSLSLSLYVCPTHSHVQCTASWWPTCMQCQRQRSRSQRRQRRCHRFTS